MTDRWYVVRGGAAATMTDLNDNTRAFASTVHEFTRRPVDHAGCDDALLLASASADRQAFGEFYLRHANGLYAFFRHRGAAPQDAYDLVAETFAQALQSVAEFDGERGTPRGWLYGIAKNKYRHLARRGAVETRARQRMRLDVGPLPTEALDRLEELIDIRDVRERLEPAIESLPPRLGEAVRLRCIDGQSYDEIAGVLDIKPAAARKRVSRALEQLERVLPTNPYLIHD
jgi:RNA polymerase sigma-70 factor (ECF subfamily)